MTIINVMVDDQRLEFSSMPVVASEGVKETYVKFALSSDWSGFGATALFYRDDSPEDVYTSVLDGAGLAEVPYEITAAPGWIRFGLSGSDGTSVHTSEILKYKIVKGKYTSGQSSEPPAPGIYEQMLAIAGQMRDTLNAAVIEQNAIIQGLVTDMTDLRSDMETEQTTFESVVTGQINTLVNNFAGSSRETILFEGSHTVNIGDEIDLVSDPTVYDYLDIVLNDGMVGTIIGPTQSSHWRVTGETVKSTGTSVTTYVIEGVLDAQSLCLRVSTACAIVDTGTASTRYDLGSGPIADESLRRYCLKVIGRKLTDDAEVLNIRVGADGVTYQTAGTAVRSQLDKKLNAPISGGTVDYGTSGQLLATDGQGNTEWVDSVIPDGSITVAKLAPGVIDTTYQIQGAAASSVTVGQSLASKANVADVTSLGTRVTAVEDAIAEKADADDVGDLSQLTTTAKDNLVATINQLNGRLVEQEKSSTNAENVLYFNEHVSKWDEWERGMVHLYNDPWTYPANNTAIRNKKGQDILLNVGMVVGLSDYATYEYYIGARQTDGAQIWSSGTWLSADTYIGRNGWYGIMVKRHDSAILTDEDIETIKGLVFIKHNNTSEIPLSVFNGYIRADGALNVDIMPNAKKHITTQAIPVSFGEKYVAWENIPSGTIEIFYCFYTSPKNALGARTSYTTTKYVDRNGNKTGYVEITVPEGAKYMRLSFNGTGTYALYKTSGVSGENIMSENDVRKTVSEHEQNLIMLNKLHNNIPARLVLDMAKTPVLFNTFTNEMYIPSGTLVFIDKTRYSIPAGIALDISLATTDTTVLTVVFDTSTQSFAVIPNASYSRLTDTQYVVCTMRWYPYSCDRIKIDLDCPWSLNGQMYGVPRQNSFVKGIAHRGLSYTAPENTLISFRLASLWGFQYAETDVMFTRDNVPVLLHDPTINRTARNNDGTELTTTINIADITYNEALQYDFGVWKNNSFKGERIPKFEDFISLCRRMSLCPCIELKTDANLTQEKIKTLVDIVVSHGLKYIARWVSFSAEYLSIVKSYLPKAGLHMLTNGITDDLITTAIGLKTADNQVVIGGSTITQAQLDRLIAADVEYTQDNSDDPNAIVSGNPYSLWQTSDGYIAGVTLSGYELRDLKL